MVALLALIAYVPGFWWGAPTATATDRVQSWGTDDETPLGPLAEMDNIIHPKANRNLGYPLLYSFLVTAAYSPYLLYLKATGQLHGMAATYPFGLADPAGALRTLAMIAHFLTVLLAVTAVVAAYDAVTSLWDRTTGFLSALFVLTLYPMFYYARTGNVDVPMLAFLALTLAALARILAFGMTRQRGIWLGIFAGLTLATKEGAVGTLVPAAFVALVLGRRAGGWKVPAFALLASVLALGVGSGLIVDPHRWIDHVMFIAGRVHDAPSTKALPTAFPFTWDGHVAFAVAIARRLRDAMTTPGLLLGVAGAIVASIRDRRALLFALAIPAHLAVAFLMQRAAYMRYLIPVAWILAVFAGWMVVTTWRTRMRAPRIAVAGLAAAALVVQLLNGASLTWEMLRDSRHAAAAWIAAHVKPGDRVEFFGAAQKLPPLPAGVVSTRAAPYFGMWTEHDTSSAVADSIERRWSVDKPAIVIVIPDHSSRLGLPYDISVPPSLYDGLLAGRRSYKLAAFFQTPPLFAWHKRPALDYPTVNPPIRIFAPN